MEKRKLYIRAVCRGIVTVVASTILYLFISVLLQIVSMNESPLFASLEPYVVSIFATAILPFIYNSFSLSFSYSDRDSINEFLEREEKEIYFKDEFKHIFTSGRFIAEFITEAVLTALFAALGFFISFGGMFPNGMPLGIFLPVICITPILFCLSVFSKYEAARFYSKLERENEIDKLLSVKWLINHLVLIMVLYPIAAPFSPLLVFAVYTIFKLILEITALFTVFTSVIIVLVLILIVWGIRVLRGISRRKRFIKRLLEISETEGYAVSKIKTPYRSFVTSKNHCSFTLTIDGESFDCLMISTLWYRTALIFTSPTDAHYAHVIGSETRNFTIRHRIEFYHRNEGEKIVIVDPVPKNVFVSEDNKQRRVNCTDTIWNISVHDADSFIGCAERRCLNKRNNLQD